MDFQYREKNSAVHRLNPLCKITWVLALSVTALLFDHPVYLGLLFLSTLAMVFASGTIREWLAFMKWAFLLALMLIVLNVLVNYQGTHTLWQAPFVCR
jgi:energy-coupling factor transporter transmembrane protein EcfT